MLLWSSYYLQMSEQNNNAGLGGSRNGGYDLKNRIQSDLDVNLLLRCSALDPRFKKLKFLNDKTDREDIFELLETELIALVEQERNNDRQENINEGDSVRTTEQLSKRRKLGLDVPESPMIRKWKWRLVFSRQYQVRVSVLEKIQC